MRSGESWRRREETHLAIRGWHRNEEPEKAQERQGGDRPLMPCWPTQGLRMRWGTKQ